MQAADARVHGPVGQVDLRDQIAGRAPPPDAHLLADQPDAPFRGVFRKLDPRAETARRLHAVLTPAPDGTWSILDPGSANGTLVNGREIAIGETVTLHEGDRINLGAWTVITVHRG